MHIVNYFHAYFCFMKNNEQHRALLLVGIFTRSPSSTMTNIGNRIHIMYTLLQVTKNIMHVHKSDTRIHLW